MRTCPVCERVCSARRDGFVYALSHPSRSHLYTFSRVFAVLRPSIRPFLDVDGPAAASEAREDASASTSVWRSVVASVFMSGSTSEAERWMIYNWVAFRFPRTVVVGAAAAVDVAIAFEGGKRGGLYLVVFRR